MRFEGGLVVRTLHRLHHYYKWAHTKELVLFTVLALQFLSLRKYTSKVAGGDRLIVELVT
jgi:hypothetical protein